MVNKDEKLDKTKLLESAVKDIQDKYGEGAIMKLGEARKVDVDSIPTGSFSLDMALGVGGVPRGRIIELFGPESSGKTTLALHIIREAQRKGGLCAFVDAEHALDPEYAKKIGVKINDLLISQPDTGEQALEIVESLVRSNAVDVIVVDSVAALTPRAEIEGEMGQQHLGLQARLMSHALRKLTAIVAKSKTVIIFINQIRMQIGVMWGCLNYKSPVMLADGSTEWIGRIVNQRKPVSVLSFDWRRGRIVSKKVSAWYKNGDADLFLQITAYKPYGNGKIQFSCTPNHPILTPVGWRRAETLQEGDKILAGVPYRLSSFQWEIIRGSLMGDGGLSRLPRKESYGVRFRIKHGKDQRRYCLWKAGLFKNIPHSLSIGQKSGAIQFDLTPLPELFELWQNLYRKRLKFLDADFITKLTPLSLAVWYMDDAHLDIRDKQQTKGRITICIESIHPESRPALISHLKNRYNIETKMRLQGRKTVLTFNQKDTDKFLLLIRRYIHPSMYYKLLPVHRGKFSVRPVYSQPIWQAISVPIVQIKVKPKTKSMVRFDIGIRGTHNFLADGAIVHNSPETTPGGKALKFYSSVRIDVRRAAQIKKGEEIIGNRVKAKIVKNKVAPPFKTAEFDIFYNEGISYEAEIINAALKYNLIKKSGASLTYGSTRLGQGFDNAKNYLKENTKVRDEIMKKIKEAIKE